MHVVSRVGHRDGVAWVFYAISSGFNENRIGEVFYAIEGSRSYLAAKDKVGGHEVIVRVGRRAGASPIHKNLVAKLTPLGWIKPRELNINDRAEFLGRVSHVGKHTVDVERLDQCFQWYCVV